MCFSAVVEFSGCRHKCPQYVECDDVKRGEKCKKVRTSKVVYHQECPRCDPGYSVRTNTPPILGLRLSKSVQELQEEAARAIELARAQAYDSTASSLVGKRGSKESDKKAKRKSTSSQDTDDGGIKGKLRGMLKGLDRMGSLARKEKGKDLNIVTASPRKPSAENKRFSPTSPLAQKPAIIMPDENGYFHALRASVDGGRVAWAADILSASHGDSQERMPRRSIGATLLDGPTTSAPELSRTNSRRHVPEHSLSLESGKDESRMLEEMWIKERSHMQSPEPLSPSNVMHKSPLRHESGDRDHENKVLNVQRLISKSEETNHSRSVLILPSSKLSAKQPRAVEVRTNSETRRPSPETRKPSTERSRKQKPGLQACPPDNERRQQIEAQAEAIRAADAEKARRERSQKISQRAQGEGRRPSAQRNGSDNWDEHTPRPLGTSHNKKPSVDTIHEVTVVPEPVQVYDWEKCGIDYLEEHRGTFPATWTSSRLAEEYRSLIDCHTFESDTSVYQ